MQSDVLIIGASFAGLSTAAALQKMGVGYSIIEKEDRVGAPWHHHYHRLHLHTPKSFSNLPYKKFPASTPRYPSRRQVIDYLEDYRHCFSIDPAFQTEALSSIRIQDHWETTTTNGVYTSKYLVMATGRYNLPKLIDIKGQESFPGKIIHSSQYRTGSTCKGKTVLVVGFGNSACEIALDLYEQGAHPVMSVRSPINVVPRDMAGIPVLALSYFLQPLPPRIADILSRPLTNGLIGNLSSLGLHRKTLGPLEDLRRFGNPPVLDIGTIRQIRTGHIGIRPGIDRIAGDTVFFTDGNQQRFDTIITATGYLCSFRPLQFVDPARFLDLRFPVTRQQYFGKDGLYFCGYWISPTGQIRSIASDARLIAKHIAARKTIL
jgi:cation diffusion facilitator CzcD-associated flavoprotein CzcO